MRDQPDRLASRENDRTQPTAGCAGCGAALKPSSGRPRKWCSERCRKARYGGTCDTCGGPTDGSGGRALAPTTCRACFRWSAEEILLALTEWSAKAGRTPRACDTRSSNRLPSQETVSAKFGSWNKGLAAAGLQLNHNTSQETHRAILDAVRAGEPIAEIAARHGMTRAAIYQRLRNHGTPVRGMR